MALNRTAVLSFAALALAAGSAAAQSNEDAPMPGAVLGSHRVLNLNPDGFGSRTLGVVTVFDSADFDSVNNPSYTGFTQAWCADWGNAELPRVGAGTLGNFSQTVEEVSFGISNNAAGVFNDVIITFYDNPKNWEIGGVTNTGGFQAAATTVLGAFIVELPAETSQFPTFDAFTVIGLSALAAPIVLNDNFFGVAIDFVLQGTTTRDTQAVHIFNTTESGVLVGWSEDRFARDVDINGTIEEDEMARVFTGASNPANLFLRVNVNFCDTDFDGSGFSDSDDFDAYVRAFEAGC